MTTLLARWVRRNLFGKPFDIALSVVIIPATAWALYALVYWTFFVANWGVLVSSSRVLMVGIYPPDQLWRAWGCVVLIAAIFGSGLGLTMAPTARVITRVLVLGCAAGSFVASGAGISSAALAFGSTTIVILAWKIVFFFDRARKLVLPTIIACVVAIFVILAPPGFDLCGGLLLSVMLTLSVSVLTLPLGILLAFGRQSRVPSLRVICTAYIETMRSVPLILVVYWIWIVVPLLAPNATPTSLMRGIAGYVVFFAAYAAEYVRSGLQALPKGQIEAAQSLGMRSLTVNFDIVLPQALRVVVPALVGQILDIFNAATLVFIIGLTDFLRAGQMILADPHNSARIYEVYVFMFGVYLAIGGLITYSSRRLEAHLARGAR